MAKMNRAVGLIVNTHASRVTARTTAAVEAAIRRHFELRMVRTESAGDAWKLANMLSADEKICGLFVFSGDGGFNEALNGLTRRIPIGFIPGGRTNVLPRMLGIGSSPEVAAASLAKSLERVRIRQINLGHANGRRFAFTAGVGLDAEFARAWDRLPRTTTGARVGDLSFLIAAVRVMASYRFRVPATLEVEGIGPAAFALVANGSPQSYLGRLPLRFAPRASFDRGLDLVTAREMTAQSLLMLFARALTSRRPDRQRHISYRHDLQRFTVRCAYPRPLHVDGEDLGDSDEVLFENEPGAVAALIP